MESSMFYSLSRRRKAFIARDVIFNTVIKKDN